MSTEDPSPLELYNLDEDIAEQNDLFAQYPEIVNELQGIMKASHTTNDLFPLYFHERANNEELN